MNPQSKRATKRTVLLVGIALITIQGLASATPTIKECKGTWSNCGVAVKQWLDSNANPNVQDLIAVAMQWNAAYDKQYNALRASGRLQKSTPDADKIFEAIKGKLDPREMAKDQAVDALVKKFLPKVAPVLKWASDNPFMVALKAFFTSSEIASDYDELRLMNDDLQGRFMSILTPKLDPDWNDKFKAAVNEAVPSIRP
jgi:hypothetical protein